MDDCVSHAQAISVVIVAAVRLYREGLVAALSRREGVTVLGAAGDFVEARAAISDLGPDVVVFDVSLPAALELIDELRCEAPDLRVVAFAVSPSSADIIACAEAGAAGYVAADASIEQLVDAIIGVVTGQLICPPSVAFDLFRRIGAPQQTRSFASETALTAREREVLRLLGSGLTNKEIARSLNIAVSTVKNHVHHVLEKTAVASRSDAARAAIQSGSRLHRDSPATGARSS
jgi:DNA-binding NarL/FixJ family response regulator